MTVEPLTGPWMRTAHYRPGRERQQWGRVVFLGIHTAEGGSSAKALGEYFQTTTREVSSHCGIGQDGGYAEYVRYFNTAWTMPPINDDTDNVELLGFAAWSRADWLRHPKMLETFAHWLAWRSEVRNIPLHVLTAAEAKAGKPGLLMHRIANDAWHASDHVDPGRNLPWDIVLARANALREVDMPLSKEDLDKIRAIVRDEIKAEASDAVWTGPDSWPALETDPVNPNRTPGGFIRDMGRALRDHANRGVV
jgi:hypothetical protein